MTNETDRSQDKTSPPFPLPQPTVFTEEFWSGCQDGCLQVYVCEDCKHLFLPGGPNCPDCWSGNLAMQPVSGLGEIFSFVVYRRTYHAAIPAPYVVALIQLAEGPRLISNVVGITQGDVTVGMPVQVRFEAEDDFILPRFEPLNTEPLNSELTSAN